jgi:hypothetical protein
LIAHYLQVKIREHILIHGDVRKTIEKTVAGHTFEVEEFADKDEEGAEERQGAFDRRNSFQLIGAKLQKGGKDIKYGKGNEMEDGDEGMEKGQQDIQPVPPMMGGGGMPMPQQQGGECHFNVIGIIVLVITVAVMK